MKKLITMLNPFIVTVIGISTVVACNKKSAPTLERTTTLLNALDITVKIADNAKTVANVTEHIKNNFEITTILANYNATITELSLKLIDNSDLNDTKIATGTILKVSGKITANSTTVDFQLTKVTLKVTSAKKAAIELNPLDITVTIADNAKTVANVTDHIKNAFEITTILANHNATISELTVKLEDNTDLDDAKINTGTILKVSGKITANSTTVDFQLTKVTLKVTSAKKAAIELNPLDITVTIGDNRKFAAIVTEHIKIVPEIMSILINHNAAITELTVKLEDDTDLDDGKIDTGTILKVSGKITTNTKTVDFQLTKVTLKVIPQKAANKLDANNTVKNLNKLTGTIVVNPTVIGEGLNYRLKHDPRILTILNCNWMRHTDNFILKVKNEKATGRNLVDKAIVTVSGQITVGAELADDEFSFDIKLDTNGKDDYDVITLAKYKLKQIKFIKISVKDLKGYKIAALKAELLKNSYIKTIITAPVKLENDNFIFRINGNLVTETDIRIDAIIQVKANIKVGALIKTVYLYVSINPKNDSIVIPLFQLLKNHKFRKSLISRWQIISFTIR